MSIKMDVSLDSSIIESCDRQPVESIVGAKRPRSFSEDKNKLADESSSSKIASNQAPSITKHYWDVDRNITVIVYPDGRKYEGKFKNGERNGYGNMTYDSGNKYAGEWKNNLFNGQGVYTMTNGDRYDGELKNDKFSGRGVYTWTNGSRYEGEWMDCKRNGRGVCFYSNGSKYVGEWKDDKQNRQQNMYLG